MEIEITQSVDLDKLINKDIDNLSEKDLINISKITEKNNIIIGLTTIITESSVEIIAIML